jgi:hypothetical protein
MLTYSYKLYVPINSFFDRAAIITESDKFPTPNLMETEHSTPS